MQGRQKNIKNALGTLLLIVAANAMGGGIYGLAGAPGVPIKWLDGSIFASYLVPSIFLFLVIGVGCLLAGIAVLKETKRARPAAMLCSLIIIAWLMFQVQVIGYVSLLQPATLIAALLILLLSLAYDTKAYSH